MNTTINNLGIKQCAMCKYLYTVNPINKQDICSVCLNNLPY